MSPESGPRVWRSIRGGATREFEAQVVAQKPNPGPIFKFHEQLKKFHSNMMDICAHDENPECLVSCTPEETGMVRGQLLKG